MTVSSPDDEPAEAEIVEDGGRPNFSFSVEQWQLQTPMLPAAMMREYEDLVPGFSKRFVDNWERQTEHRQSLERTVVAAQSTTQVRGQKYALVLGVTALLVSGAAAVTGHEATAIAITGMDFLSLGGAFVYSKRKESQELAAKAEQVPDPGARSSRQAELPKGKPTAPRPRQSPKKKRRR